MPIEIGIWRLGEKPQRVRMSSLDSESRLEETLAKDISIIWPKLMLIGRQVATAFGKFIDLLVVDSEGNLIVIELKRKRTPREVVAQLLDYGSWVQGLSYDDITGIYADKNEGKALEESWEETFNTSPPEELNQSHKLMVVASDLDASTERIIDYLSDNYGVPINAVFFRYFREGSAEYLARSWLIDPQEAEAKADKAIRKKGREPWNGRDFYVSLGEYPSRNWDDCREYGFISGGGGRWYSQTLDLLFPGARVFVNIPKTGYVGVDIVKEESKPVREFMVEVDGREMPILEAPLKATEMGHNVEDPDLCEYCVRVEWMKAVSREQAYWEKGLFAVQHTACRLRNRFTIERLTQHFGIDE
ncbi:MAG: DUF91 domain-containing protein [Planctomycetes bacterium]|nr:DUF91 domain-containing protein [Planctomycetota bacterium]